MVQQIQCNNMIYIYSIISEILYKEKFSYETEKVIQTIVKKWLPKSTDAKVRLIKYYFNRYIFAKLNKK